MEELAIKRSLWLQENGKRESDVLEDENGEFLITWIDSGNEGDEGYNSVEKQIYLPEELQY